MNEGPGGRFARHAARSGRQDSEPSSDKGGGTSGQHTHSPSGGWGWAGMTGVAAAVRRARLIVGWMYEWVSVRSVGSGQWDRPHTRAREVFAREGELGREPTDAGRGGGRTVACSCPQRARRAPIPTHIHSLAPSQSTGAAGAARRPPRGIERPRRSTVPPSHTPPRRRLIRLASQSDHPRPPRPRFSRTCTPRRPRTCCCWCAWAAASWPWRPGARRPPAASSCPSVWDGGGRNWDGVCQ